MTNSASKIFTELKKKLDTYLPANKLGVIEKAYDFSAKAHQNQKRLSGDPYITHPLQAALTLADLKQDEKAIATALLHDTLEDTDTTEDEIKENFGDEILKLVIGVSKISALDFSSDQENQQLNLRHMILAMAADIRVVIIKLADRMHNMQTIEFLDDQSQKRVAKETLEIYAPLAHRLGMWNIKWQLEDLSFEVLQNEEYKKIKDLVSEKREEREKYIEEFKSILTRKLGEATIKVFELKGRSKHFYSINRKLKERNISFAEVFDLQALRVIVGSIKDCYGALGIIHANWKPISGKFKDYVAMPKSNLYQSLHTTVLGPDTKRVEIQIRTADMDKIAEEGIASHWKYKEGIGDKVSQKMETLEEKMAWLRHIMEWKTQAESTEDFIDHLKVDLFTDEVFVFTPKGKVIALPTKSTPVDFAYHIHTQIGHRCKGAKLNGHIVPLNTRLNNGDIVEILTANKDNPSLDWLSFVETHSAKSKLKSWFRKHQTEETIKRGEEELLQALKQKLLTLKDLTQETVQKNILKRYRLKSLDELYLAVGRGEISAATIAKNIYESHGASLVSKIPPETTKIEEKPKPIVTAIGAYVPEAPNILVHLAQCCSPIPGDEIIGLVSKGHGVAIHRFDCPNLTAKQSPAGDIPNSVRVAWDKESKRLYQVQIVIEGFNRPNLFTDIISTISESGTNISSANMITNHKQNSILAKIIVEVNNLDHLQKINNIIRKVSDVYDVKRVIK